MQSHRDINYNSQSAVNALLESSFQGKPVVCFRDKAGRSGESPLPPLKDLDLTHRLESWKVFKEPSPWSAQLHEPSLQGSVEAR